jgi:hypothetical protein
VAGTHWRKGIDAVLPADASASPVAFIESVSCPSAGNCGAVGFYYDSLGHAEGLLLTETAGRWTRGVEAVLPANAATDPAVGLHSVSCASAGNCSAVGDYKAQDSSGLSKGLLLTETAGGWAPGVEAALPADAPTPEGSSLVSVSCASAGNCVAAGTDFDGSGIVHALLVTETASSWGTGVEAALPADASTTRVESSLDSVSCPSAGNCGAVGYYVSSSGCQGLLLTETDGSWTAGVEARPVDAVGCAVTFAVSCPSAGSCSAVIGRYLLTQTAGTWEKGVATVLPANACPVGPGPGQCDSAGGDSDSISCASPGNCVAVGEYTDSSGVDQGLLLTESAGTWRAGVEAPHLADTSGVSLTSVSCASARNCSAVGQDGLNGLLLTETAGKWVSVAAALPANAAGPDVNLYSVSCASARHCSAVGVDGVDGAGKYAGLLLDSFSPQQCVVPRLTGKALVAARRSIKSHACSVGAIKRARSQRVKKGHVISQQPRAGRRLRHGAKVALVVSKGRPRSRAGA